MFTPVLAKHTKSFNLVDTLSVGVDRIQRDFEPMQRQVESWSQTQITDAQGQVSHAAAGLIPMAPVSAKREQEPTPWVFPQFRRQKPLGRVLGFGCENAWGQQITESDPSQHLGANPI